MIVYAMNQLGLKCPGTAANFYENTKDGTIKEEGFSSNAELDENKLVPGDVVLRKSEKPEYNYGGNGVHHVALVSDPVMVDGELNVIESTGSK